jgi:hypothetical protein
LRLSIQEWRQDRIYNRQLVLRNTVSFVVSATHLCVTGWADSKGRASDSVTWMRVHCINLKVKGYNYNAITDVINVPQSTSKSVHLTVVILCQNMWYIIY